MYTDVKHPIKNTPAYNLELQQSGHNYVIQQDIATWSEPVLRLSR